MQADQMSIWHLVSGASVLVQLVMLTLLAASVVSWVMIFQRSSVMRSAKNALDDFEDRFWSGVDLSQLYRQVTGSPDENSGLEQIFRAGFKEFSRMRQQSGVDPDAVMDAVQRSMRVAISHGSAGNAGNGSAGYRRGAGGDGHWSVCRDSGGGCLQPFLGSLGNVDWPVLHLC